MVMLVTLQEAKDHLRVDNDADDNDITLKIHAASAIVINYLKSNTAPYEPELDSMGDPIVESDGSTIPIVDSNGDFIPRYEVKAAVLLMLGVLYRDRDGQEMTQWQLGYLPFPVQSLLYPLRDPALE